MSQLWIAVNNDIRYTVTRTELRIHAWVITDLERVTYQFVGIGRQAYP
ncbi:hypothetical protein SDC9_173908 [bioreactor metagenome]|uniref:Uncharacterized protein n=1 Tax=bioreactor metagenome TaxID=1076179 RepID=A0A645GS73_9ZZZZ